MFEMSEANITSKIHPLPSNWLISFKNPQTLWNDHWLALLIEIGSFLILYQLYRHAKKREGESHYMILTAMMATICFEILPFIRTGYELWWYHEGLVNLLQRRLPSYAISFFALTHYLAYSLARKSNLPYLASSLATSVLCVFIISPFLWMSTRLLLVDYHFDDPVFKDRIVDIPYIQLLVLLLLSFHTTHLFRENIDALQQHERHSYNFVCCALQSGIFAGLYTIVEQYILYLLLKLILNLNTATCIIAALAMMTFVVKREIQSLQLTSITSLGLSHPLKRKALWTVAAGFIFLTTIPLWLNFENLKSTSSRLELGPCHVLHNVSNTSPLYTTRLRYICPEDTNALMYDFNCLTKEEISLAVQNNEKNYTVCGKTMTDYIQVVQKLAMYSIFCLIMFYNVMRFSFTFKNQQVPPVLAKKIS